MTLRRLSTAALSLTLGCTTAVEADATAPAPTGSATLPDCDADTPLPVAAVSPGGTPEVSIEALASAHCRVRIIDVRSEAEVARTGVIPGSEHVPMERVPDHATAWDREQPIVLVCRSGRRSGSVARELVGMGFTEVASLTGGVLAWRTSGRTMTDTIAKAQGRLPEAHRHALTLQDVRAHVADRDRVRMTKAATLLLHGSQACVDGRDAHAIVGTPGGDAGELVLALAAAETLGRAPFSAEDVDRVFADYLEAFGHFYLHTDHEAAQQWLASAGADDADPAAILRRPPQTLRSALLETVAVPANVGCGHLRLSLQHAEAYGVRPGLVRDVMRSYFTRLWAGDGRLDFVVLEGDHAESAIVQVQMGRKVHAYSKVPLVSPRVGDTEVFIVHPEVSAFVREQNASFLLEEVPSLMSAGVDEARFLETLQGLAAQQLGETIAHLAPDLPVFVMKVVGDDITVEAASSPAPPERTTQDDQ